ncbi:MAG: GAF domain-containing protein [Chloroflexi bacterium]|nr:GAF domain-containing protein [Chloroflexota bacterium]
MLNLYRNLSKPEKRALGITAMMALVFAAFAGSLIDTLLDAPNLQYALVNLLPFILAVIALISALLFLAGKVAAASWLIQVGTFTSLLLAVTQAEGYGFPAAFVLIAVTLYIPLQTLKGRQASVSLGVGVAGTLAIIILDTFWTGFRVPALAQDVLIAAILSIILALILILSTILQFSRYAIRTRLLILAMGTGMVSILAVAILTTITTQNELTTQTRASLVSAAKHVAAEIDTYIGFNLDTIAAEAQLPEVVAFLQATPQQQEKSRSELLELFNTLAQRDSTNIGSYALLNSDGIDVVDTYTADIGLDKSDRDYFLQTRRTGRPFVTPVRYSPTSPDHGFYIAVPVKDENGRFIGVLRVRLRSSLLNDIVRKNNEFAGRGSYGILLDEFNLVIAHGTNPQWVSRTLVEPEVIAYSLLRMENRIKDTPREDMALHMPNFSQNMRSLAPNQPYFSSTDEAWGSPVEVGVARSSKNVFLKVAYVQPQAIAFEAVERQTQVTVIVTLLTGLAILFSSYFVSRTITLPIAKLAATAEEITAGNLSARVEYDVNDELGTLANAFNRMTNQLRDTLGGLERRVAERTADVELARLLSERRAQDLQSISEISRAISTEQRLEILLPLIARLVSERFDFYHVGIFFLDETRRFVYLQAANSDGGQRMLARGHRLEIGTGLVGTVAQTGKPRIALDVGSDASFFNNPDLPATRSEMALPLTFRGNTIGVLDVQSTKPGAFTESDANTLSILADQIAIAIENARLFGQMQNAREEAEALYSQIQRQEWKSFVQQETRIGFRQTATGGRRLIRPVDTDEIRAALQSGQVVVVEGKDTRSNPTIAMPVKLRGQTIGVLNIKAPTRDRKWNTDEINLVQAISDRLALALDNARLVHESQRRAAKEAKIGEVTAKIGASINMQNVLQTAVEELGRALPGSEVIIQFEQADGENTP